MPPSWWFPERGEGVDNHGTLAKGVCADCTVRVECLTYAVEVGESAGIWGGVGEDRRAGLRRVYLSGDAVEWVRALAAEADHIAVSISGFPDDRVPVWQAPCVRCGDRIWSGTPPPDRNGPNATCGRPSTYNRGCRCERCVLGKGRYAGKKSGANGSPRGETSGSVGGANQTTKGDT